MKILATAAMLALTTLPLAATPAVAADDAGASAKVMTIFVDGHGQTSFADKVNKVHAEQAAKGWEFADLEIYTENGDMKGAFITYKRD
jgi:hypothetical protein